MKILQIHNRYRQPGGEDAVVEAEASLLRSAGHTVLVDHTDNPPGAAAGAAAFACAPMNFAAERRVVELVRTHDPDVAHVHNTWFALSPSVIRGLHRAGVPIVHTLHNYRLLCANGLLFRDGGPCEDCVGTHPWHGVLHRCYRDSMGASVVASATVAAHRALGTMERVSVFLALTDFARRRFIAGGVPAARIQLHPHFATDPGPRPAPPSASSTVLFVGRLSVGLAVVLASWKRLADPGLELVVIGDGPERAGLERRQVPGVRFLGPQPAEVVRWWALRSRALLFPSVAYETFGMTVIEALAAGLPAVVSAHGAAAELVAPLGREWLAAPGDVDDWLRALRRLRHDPAVAAGGAAARQRYEQVFSPGAALAPLETAYRRALAVA